NPQVGITLTDNLNGTITITSEQNVLWYATVSNSLNLDQGSSTETWVNAIQQSFEENDSPYVVMIESHNIDDVTSVGQYIESTDRFFYGALVDNSIKSSADLPAGLSGLSRAAVVWSQASDEEYPEAKHVGEVIPAPVGSRGWCFRSAGGLTK